MPSLAVVVVSYNVRDLLRACLAATAASLALAPQLDASVIVVDNASTDGSAEMVAREFPQVTLVAREDNLGFAGGNNLALRRLGFLDGEHLEFPARSDAATLSGSTVQPGAVAIAREGFRQESGDASRETRRDPGDLANPLSMTQSKDATLSLDGIPDLVLLLNPDAEPVGDAIGQMARFLLAHPQVGGAGAQLEYPDGRFQHGVFRFPGLLQLWFDFFLPRPRRLLESRLNGRYGRGLFERGRPFPVDFALGAALMVRREAIQAAGLLDEGYFMYAEEVDWCWRIRRAGWPFYCVPTARVIHHGGASTRQFRARSFLNLWRSRARLYRRFYGPLRRRAAALIVGLGMAAEARRARAEAARGQVGAEELAVRLDAIGRVRELFRSI